MFLFKDKRYGTARENNCRQLLEVLETFRWKLTSACIHIWTYFISS